MCGFRGSALGLMESYLTNRYQYTKIGDSKSRKQLIDCGVPQWSSLGPLLFLLYVNVLPHMSQLSTTLFADDTLLSLSDANLSRLENRVITQLQYIAQWLNQNKLILNYLKTTYLLFNKLKVQQTRTDKLKVFVTYKSKRNFLKRISEILGCVV